MHTHAKHNALYCRLSPRPDGTYEGVEEQEDYGRAYAGRTWPELPIVVYKDPGLSAVKENVYRPDYERLRENIRDGWAVNVWAVEQSRLTRQEIGWFELAAELTTAGIKEVHTRRDGIIRVGDEVAGIKAVLNAVEVRKMLTRQSDHFDAMAARGEPPGSKPFGYMHIVNEDGVRSYGWIPEQAEAIQFAAERFLAGWSQASIATEVRKRGIVGAYGGEIAGHTVRGWLKNPSVAGKVVRQGKIVGNGNWRPILDEDTWEACKQRLSAPRDVLQADGRTYSVGPQHLGNPTGRKYVLTGGRITCGVCKAPLIGSKRKLRRNRIDTLYMCHPNKGGKGCVGIMLQETDEVVQDRLFAELDKPEFLAAIDADTAAPRRREIGRALKALGIQRDELAAMWARPGELTMSEWQAARQGLAEQEGALRIELAELPPPLVDIDLENAREAFLDMTLGEQRHFVGLFIEQVIVLPARRGLQRYDPDRVEVRFRRR